MQAVVLSPRSSYEKTLEVLAFIGLILGPIILLVHWSDIPSRVPNHFGTTGEPNSWGGKSILIVYMIITVSLFSVFTFAGQFPHKCNYAWPITEANASAQYQIARSMLSCLKAQSMWLFVFLEWKTTQIAREGTGGLGVYSLPVFLLFTIGTVGFYLLKGYRNR
jgi:uncharacterized membrane protein